MELKVVREEFNLDQTVGKLYANGIFICYTIEDRDRGLTNDMDASEIKRIKIAHKTAVNYGRYRVILSYSNKLKRYLPLMLDIRSWVGCRLHRGSTPNSSSGCICLGMERKIVKGVVKLDKIKEAEKKVIDMLEAINRTESSYIEITKK